MASIERTAYPRFKRIPNSKQLSEIYSPSLHEITYAHQFARGDASILSFLTQMKCFQRLGYFPSPSDIPAVIVNHIRSYVNLPQDTIPTDSLDMRDILLFKRYIMLHKFEPYNSLFPKHRSKDNNG